MLRSVIRPLVALVCLAVLAVACNSDDAGTTSTTAAPPPTTTAAPTTILATTAPPPPPVDALDGVTFSVADFGAVADAKEDDAPAFQRAIDAAEAAGGGVVLIPPVSGRDAYVLASPVRVATGVALVGSTTGTSINVGGPYPWPETDLGGVKILARPDVTTESVFVLEPGTTVRGLWISYDQQPMPTDAELADPDGDYVYRTFTEARDFFIDEHVAAMAPTFLIEDASQVTLADLIGDRYFDFAYVRQGGPLRVDGVTLFGFNKGFVVADSDARNVFTNVHFAPVVGPYVPTDAAPGESRSWVFGAIASRVDNVGFHLGRSDGYVLDNVATFGVNTGIRLGASFEYPIVDPIDATFYTSEAGLGPWGQISNLNLEHAAVGIHLVAPAKSTTILSNVAVTPDIDDGQGFAISAGTGEFADAARQGAILAEASYNSAGNGVPEQVPSLLATNLTVSARAAPELFADAAANVDTANGRIFLVDGDIGMEVHGFAMSDPYGETLMIGSGTNAVSVNIRIRGVLVLGRPESDRLVERDKVTVLNPDIVVVETQPPTTTSSSTSSTSSTTEAPTSTTEVEED